MLSAASRSAWTCPRPTSDVSFIVGLSLQACARAATDDADEPVCTRSVVSARRVRDAARYSVAGSGKGYSGFQILVSYILKTVHKFLGELCYYNAREQVFLPFSCSLPAADALDPSEDKPTAACFTQTEFSPDPCRWIRGNSFSVFVESSTKLLYNPKC